MAEYLQLYYVYSTGQVALPAVAGAQVNANISILADADFACHYISGVATQANLIVLNWAGLVQINDAGVGRTFFNVAIPFDSIAGNARQPYPLPIPRRVARNSTLVLTFTNPVATATNVHLSLHGYKLYPGEGPSAPSR